MDTPVYASVQPFAERQSATVVVTCTSHAYTPYVREFLERHLGLAEGTYDTLSVPGGPQFLLLTEYLPKFAWAGRRWVKFLVERHRLRRAVLISHAQCAWHDDERMVPALVHRLLGAGGGSGAGGAGGAAGGDAEQAADLRRMAAALHAHLPGLAIEAYLARREPDGRVGFVRVA
jgi:hypothetical protein